MTTQQEHYNIVKVASRYKINRRFKMKFEANTKTLFKVVATSSDITDITNGKVYDIYSDVDNEWFVIDDKGDKRYTFFSDNEIKEFYSDDFVEVVLKDYGFESKFQHNVLDDETEAPVENAQNIDGFLVYDIKETIYEINRKLELLEIFVNNLSIEPISGNDNDE